MAFLIIGLSERFGKWVYIFSFILALIFAFPGMLNNLLLKWGALVDARYMNYLRGAIYSTLNVTGLFQYFFIFIGFLMVLVCVFKTEQNEEEARFNRLSVVSGVLAIAVLFDIRFNTIIASRLADLLLLPLLLSLGMILQSIKNTKRKLLFVCIAALLGYCAIRGFITFSPRPPSPLPSIE
jgi:membrane-associated HD superfamily phosphohydrolase